MIQGDNVIIDVNENIDGTKGKLIKKTGVFIKDYGEYIQIMNRFGLRESIMKTDIKNIKII